MTPALQPSWQAAWVTLTSLPPSAGNAGAGVPGACGDGRPGPAQVGGLGDPGAAAGLGLGVPGDAEPAGGAAAGGQLPGVDPVVDDAPVLQPSCRAASATEISPGRYGS